MEYIPLKKRRFWPQSPSPPPRPPAPSLDHEVSLPSQPQDPSPQLRESEQLVNSKCSSSQQSDSNLAVKSAHGADEARIDAMISEVTDVDFSGIALLAATACSSSIRDDDHNVKDASVMEEYAATREEATTSATQIEETMTSLELDKSLQKDSINVDKADGLLVQDNSSALSHNLHNDKNDGAVGMLLPPKSNRLHWDLNTSMDEWEEPYVEIFNSQTTDSGSVLNDGMTSGKVTSEVCKVQRDFEDTLCDIGSKVHSLSCGLVSSDPQGNQLIIDPKPDIENNTLQVSSGPISIEKTCVATSTDNMLESLKFSVAETKAPSPVISTSASLHNCGCPISDHIACTCVGEKLNTPARMLVQHEKDISRTSATIHGTLSLQNVQAGKIDVVSTDMPILDKPVCYTDGIKNNDGEDIGKTSGKGPNFSGKLSSEDPSSDCNGSDVSQDNRGHIVSMENIKELQEGYDSPFEEGELREPVVCSWDDIEVEGWETGRQDNQSVDKDNIDAHDKKGEKSGMGGKDAGSDKAVEHCGQDSWMKPSRSWSSKTKAYGGNQFRDHRDVNAEGNWDEYDDKGSVAGEFGARQSRQKFSSHIEGPYYDPIHRKNPGFLQQQRSENLPYSYSRVERDFDKSPRPDHFSFPGHGINEEDGHWVNSSVGYRNSGNRYSRTYRGPEGHNYFRPRGLIPNSSAVGSALNYNDNRWSVNYSSNDTYRPFIRRRSPPMRGGSPAWSQGRSEIYAHCVRRGFSKEYHEGVPYNAGASSTRIPHYLGRRDRGFSPNIGRGAHFSRPHRNSRSISRSRSPLTWRVHRDCRSPVRTFRLSQSQSQRCDSVEYSGRLKSDDNLRSFISWENFSQMAGAGRGHNFENNNDGRRKHNDRFERIGRVRHYDASGNMRQYRHNAEDFFEDRNSRGEDDCSTRTFGRDAPRSPREERGTSKYDIGRIDASALSSGEQELEEENATKDVARSAREESKSSNYNSYRIDNSSFLSGQQDLEKDAAPRDVLMRDREERGSSKDGIDKADTSASSYGQQELDEDAAPKGD